LPGGTLIALQAAEMANDNRISRNPIGRFEKVSGTLFVMAFAILPFVAGCSNDCSECPDPAGTNAPPYPPDGVFSITGDGQITLCWNDKTEPYIIAYGLYRDRSWDGDYSERIAYVEWADVCEDLGDGYWTCCVDITGLDNGETWFYAVSSVNERGIESEILSYEIVFDTPRPEGSVVLRNYLGQNPASSGYDLASLTSRAQAWDDITTDIYFGTLNDTIPDDQSRRNIHYIFSASGVDIQDYGLNDVDWAPETGWSNLGRVEALPGHSYAIRITTTGRGQNYAKVRVESVTDDQVTLDWAYQQSTSGDGNRELTPGPGGGAMR
jgi:hypothetical protein